MPIRWPLLVRVPSSGMCRRSAPSRRLITFCVLFCTVVDEVDS